MHADTCMWTHTYIFHDLRCFLWSLSLEQVLDSNYVTVNDVTLAHLLTHLPFSLSVKQNQIKMVQF